MRQAHLRIDEPCTEHWDRMSAVDRGRLCTSCNKIVVDFTRMTDGQVLQWFTEHGGSACGRFRTDQLNRSLLVTPVKRGSRWQYWHYLLAGLLFSSEVSAQPKPAGNEITQQPVSGRESRNITEDTTISPEKLPPPDFIRGRVMDSSGHAVPFATVTINPKQGVAADDDGNFVINANSLRDNQLLTISAIGFQTIQVPVSKLRSDGRIQASPVVLQLVSAILGETVVVVRHSKRTKPFSDTLSLIKDSLAHLGLATTTMTVFPNPVGKGNSITVSAKFDQPGAYLVQLYSLSGILIESMDVNGQEKSENICMTIPASLASGTYVVRVSHPRVKKDYSRQIVVL
jgi:hypothetical protein